MLIESGKRELHHWICSGREGSTHSHRNPLPSSAGSASLYPALLWATSVAPCQGSLPLTRLLCSLLIWTYWSLYLMSLSFLLQTCPSDLAYNREMGLCFGGAAGRLPGGSPMHLSPCPGPHPEAVGLLSAWQLAERRSASQLWLPTHQFLRRPT